ncbi:MAG: PH domain-containing protein [Prevotella sp.]|nr:PH domain-containing protein [Prevotella sp.]
MRIVYKSKVSACIYVVYGVSILSMMPIFLIGFSWIAVIITLLLLAVETVAFFGIRYTINENTLEVKMMLFFKKTYSIDDITSISDTDSILSAPAASFDRISIDFKDGTNLVLSPKRKEEFIACLKDINESINVY